MTPVDPPAPVAPRAAGAVLDVRDGRAFAAGHLAGSGHIPAAEMAERRSELPPRETPVRVVAEDAVAAAAAVEILAGLGYAHVSWLDRAAAEAEGGLRDRAPAARLWRPSPFLEQVLPSLPGSGSGRRRVLDLAAGAGREAVFMALQGYEVEAWDHDRDVLERARAMAGRHGVSIATAVRDLEWRDPDLPAGDRDVVMVFRFLHRPLFPHLARAVAPGGCLVYETYLRGQEAFGRPKHPRFLLEPGELPRSFPGFVIERYEELTPATGPHLARMLARKPA